MACWVVLCTRKSWKEIAQDKVRLYQVREALFGSLRGRFDRFSGTQRDVKLLRDVPGMACAEFRVAFTS